MFFVDQTDQKMILRSGATVGAFYHVGIKQEDHQNQHKNTKDSRWSNRKPIRFRSIHKKTPKKKSHTMKLLSSKNSMAREAKYKMIFQTLDKNKSGHIDKADLSKGMFKMIPQKQLEMMIKMFDKDGDGKISYDEFKAVMKKVDGKK